MTQKKNLNIIKFPTSIVEAERQVEAILFAAQEPLDVETIKSRLKVKEILGSRLIKPEDGHKPPIPSQRNSPSIGFKEDVSVPTEMIDCSLRIFIHFSKLFSLIMLS